ncbi:MAG: ribonuclease P protein component [Roseibium sp.]|nr:ribonuclease P protein component [Roseibium sp.]
MKTLKKRAEFLAVSKGGRVGRRAFVVQGLKRDGGEEPRIGYTVTKKTGNAVVRSRIKRRLRAAIAALDRQDVPRSADFVLVARHNALTLPFPKLIADLKSGLPQVLDARTPRGPKRPRPTGYDATSRRKQG